MGSLRTRAESFAGKVLSRAGSALTEGAFAEAQSEHSDSRHSSDMPVRPSIPVSTYAAAAFWSILIIASVLTEGIPTGQSVLLDGRYEESCLVLLEEDAKPGTFGMSAVIRVVGGPYDGSSCLATFDAPDSNLGPLSGEVYRCAARFSAFDEDKEQRQRRKGAYASVRLSGMEIVHSGDMRDRMACARRAAVGLFLGDCSDGAALSRALVVGERSGLMADDLYDVMQINGLAHLVAVSGAHLAVISSFCCAILRRMRIPRRGAVVATGFGIMCYVFLTGCSVSVIRAAIMSVAGMMAVFAGRRTSALSVLSVCVCLMLAADPSNAWSLSFSLSVLSTLGIVVFVPLFGCWTRRAFGRVPGVVADAVAMTAAASLMTFPVTATVFSRVSLFAVATNIGATVFMGAYLPLACASVIVALLVQGVAPWLTDIIVGFTAGAAEPFCAICRLLASLPFGSLPLWVEPFAAVFAVVAVSVGLWIAWPTPSGRVLRAVIATVVALLLFVPWVARSSIPDRMVALDVGQGDAILLQSQGCSVLVDTGNVDAKLLAALAKTGVVSLDAVIITHHDDDHCASLEALRGGLPVKAVYASDGMIACDCDSCAEFRDMCVRVLGLEPSGLSYGDRIVFGDFSMRVVWPHELQDEGGNCDSVCLMVEHGIDVSDARALLVGDAESDSLGRIIEEEGIADIDIYKVGHHGSKAAITDEEAAVLSPDIALVSVGEGNRYGHPAPTTLQTLEDVGAYVCRTDELGNVCCIFGDGGITVRAMG